jgi:hypothetical protein
VKTLFIFLLKVVVSFVLVATYLFYFSNRYFVSLGGKHLTVIEKTHSYYVVEGIFLGVDIPQKALQIKSNFSNDNAISIYDTNQTDCGLYIAGDIVTGSLDGGICIVDNNATKVLAEQFMGMYDKKKLLGNLYYEAIGKSYHKAIYLQTGYKEAFHIDTGYSLVGGGTIAKKESAGLYSTVRTPLYPMFYSLAIILATVGAMRYFIKKPILNNKQPLKEKIKTVFDFGIKAIGESIIVGVINIFLLIAVFIVKIENRG